MKFLTGSQALTIVKLQKITREWCHAVNVDMNDRKHGYEMKYSKSGSETIRASTNWAKT